MTMTVPRFEGKKFKKDSKLTMNKEKDVLIVDHSNDALIGTVSLEATADKNIQLANVIVEAIESYLEEKEEGQE